MYNENLLCIHDANDIGIRSRNDYVNLRFMLHVEISMFFLANNELKHVEINLQYTFFGREILSIWSQILNSREK